MSKTKEVEIEIEGVKHNITIKKFSFKERNDLQRCATKITMIGQTPKFDIDPYTMKEEGIFRGLVKADFPHQTKQDIYDLEPALAEEIWNQIEEFNILSKKKSSISNGQSNTEQETQN